MTGRPGEHPLDPWSVVHLGSGVALGLLLRGPVGAVVTLALLLLYEGFEALLRRAKRKPGGKGVFEHESWTNIAHDVLLGQVGWLFAQGAPPLPPAGWLPW